MRKPSSLILLCLGFFCVPGFAQSIFWKIEKAGLKTSYLLGTIHVRQAAFMEMSDSVYAALARAEVVYNELGSPVDQTIETGSASYREMVAVNQRFLDSLRGTETWLRFVKKLNVINHVNFDPDSVDAINAYRSVYKQGLLAPDSKLMIPDDFIRLLGYQLGKKIGGLESLTTQREMLFNIAKQEIITLEFSSNEQNSQFTEKLLQYYLREQIDSIDLLYNEFPAWQREFMLTNRNQTMLDSMQKIMQASSAFFAVGAAHLAGEGGLIAKLRDAGYQVEPVVSNRKLSMKLIYDLNRQAIETYKRQARAKGN